MRHDRLKVLARRSCKLFRVPPFKEIRFVTHLTDCFGWCDEKGVIEIQMTKKNSKKFLSESTLIDTLSHELAHLEFFDHGAGHTNLTIALRTWMERNARSIKKS